MCIMQEHQSVTCIDAYVQLFIKLRLHFINKDCLFFKLNINSRPVLHFTYIAIYQYCGLWMLSIKCVSYLHVQLELLTEHQQIIMSCMHCLAGFFSR